LGSNLSRRGLGGKRNPEIVGTHSPFFGRPRGRFGFDSSTSSLGFGGRPRFGSGAEAAGLPASSHTFPECSVHLLGVTPTCHRLEYLDHAGPILAEPVQIKDGLALTRDCPGTGLEWDEEAVGRWLVP
jgi:hypothetical protein